MEKILSSRTRWAIFSLLLAGIVVYSRLYFHSIYLFSWDSVNYALSLREFNIHMHQPHPPGYLLYCFTLRAVNWIVQDANLSMIGMNIFATLGTCFFIVLLVLELRPDSDLVAAGAAILCATNPLFWFYGCIAELYAVEGFFATCIAYLVVGSFRNHRLLLWASAVMAVAGGFRPTTEVFLLPFYLAAFLGKDRRTILQSLAMLILMNLAWFAVLVALSGGLHPYFDRLQQQGIRAAGKTATLTEETTERGPDFRFIPIVLLQACTLPVIVALLIRARRIHFTGKQLYLSLLLIPPLLFFALVHYAKGGYLLLVIPVWICFFASLLASLYSSRITLITIFLLASLMNGWIFIGTPVRPEKKGNKSLWSQMADEFRSPNKNQILERTDQFGAFFERIGEIQGTKTLIASQKSYPTWRTMMYYLPDVQVLVIRRENNGFLLNRYRLLPVRSPFQVNSDWIITLGPEKSILPMRSFRVKRIRCSYAPTKDLPAQVRLFDSDFLNTRARTGN